MRKLTLVLFILLFLTACTEPEPQTSTTTVPDASETPTATEAALSTPTPLPTDTPESTTTTEPTETPEVQPRFEERADGYYYRVGEGEWKPIREFVSTHDLDKVEVYSMDGETGVLSEGTIRIEEGHYEVNLIPVERQVGDKQVIYLQAEYNQVNYLVWDEGQEKFVLVEDVEQKYGEAAPLVKVPRGDRLLIHEKYILIGYENMECAPGKGGSEYLTKGVLPIWSGEIRIVDTTNPFDAKDPVHLYEFMMLYRNKNGVLAASWMPAIVDSEKEQVMAMRKKSLIPSVWMSCDIGLWPMSSVESLLDRRDAIYPGDDFYVFLPIERPEETVQEHPGRSMSDNSEIVNFSGEIVKNWIVPDSRKRLLWYYAWGRDGNTVIAEFLDGETDTPPDENMMVMPYGVAAAYERWWDY